MSRRKIHWFLPLSLAFILALFCLPILAKASDAQADPTEVPAASGLSEQEEGASIAVALPEGAAPEDVEQLTAESMAADGAETPDAEPADEDAQAAPVEEEPVETVQVAPEEPQTVEEEEEELSAPLAEAPIVPTVMAEAHVQNIGWVAPKDASKSDIGTTGNGLRVEGFKITLSGGSSSVSAQRTCLRCEPTKRSIAAQLTLPR